MQSQDKVYALHQNSLVYLVYSHSHDKVVTKQVVITNLSNLHQSEVTIETTLKTVP